MRLPHTCGWGRRRQRRRTRERSNFVHATSKREGSKGKSKMMRRAAQPRNAQRRTARQKTNLASVWVLKRDLRARARRRGEKVQNSNLDEVKLRAGGLAGEEESAETAAQSGRGDDD